MPCLSIEQTGDAMTLPTPTPLTDAEIVEIRESQFWRDQFGADMHAKVCATIASLQSDIQRTRDALAGIRDYPDESQSRRTSDGYPSEVVYDEWAYRRMVDSYRSVARIALTPPTGT
jgi:hypothetical protein